MKPSRVTLTFTSDSGRSYLYDDQTGMIFPWTQLREAALSAYLSVALQKEKYSIQRPVSRTSENETNRFVKKWAQKYGAFVRTPTSLPQPPSPAGALEWIRRHSAQMILILTERCNLRCRYCAYSGMYKYNRVHSQRQMSPERAKGAIDWFVDLVRIQIQCNPRRQVGLTFYGGEPLLNMPALRAAVEHVQQKYAGLFNLALTTNGVLLTEDKVDFLATNSVHVVISLDGPQTEHDRERVDISGAGTHARIMNNLHRIRQTHPQYWREHLRLISVYSYKSDFKAVEAFFEQNEGKIPPLFRAQGVSTREGEFWREATSSDYKRFYEGLSILRDQYKQKMIKNLTVLDFVRYTGGNTIFGVAARNRVDDPVTPWLPFAGSCFPGQKIAVGVDGTLDVCERVDGTFPIGRLSGASGEGIDGDRVRSLIDQYQHAVLSSCTDCCVTRFCNFCFASALSGGSINKPPQMCAETEKSAKAALRDYVSILEANPNADPCLGFGRVAFGSRLSGQPTKTLQDLECEVRR